MVTSIKICRKIFKTADESKKVAEKSEKEKNAKKSENVIHEKLYFIC